MIVVYFFGGILFGFIAREMFLSWREHCELMREIDRRERAFNATLEAALILGAVLILKAAADKLSKPSPGRTVTIRRENPIRLRPKKGNLKNPCPQNSDTTPTIQQ
jgi:hypothetical protein